MVVSVLVSYNLLLIGIVELRDALNLSLREYRNDPNVLLLHYANVRKDLKGSVAKIADFLEVELTAEELDAGK